MLRGYLRGRSFFTYSITYENDNGLWLRERDHWLGVYSPGNTGRKGTVSLQTYDGKWLMEESGMINARSYGMSHEFKEASTFWVLQNLFHTGYFSLESSINAGFYIIHQNSRVKMLKSDGSTLFHNDASWLLKETGQ